MLFALFSSVSICHWTQWEKRTQNKKGIKRDSSYSPQTLKNRRPDICCSEAEYRLWFFTASENYFLTIFILLIFFFLFSANLNPIIFWLLIRNETIKRIGEDDSDSPEVLLRNSWCSHAPRPLRWKIDSNQVTEHEIWHCAAKIYFSWIFHLVAVIGIKRLFISIWKKKTKIKQRE